MLQQLFIIRLNDAPENQEQVMIVVSILGFIAGVTNLFGFWGQDCYTLPLLGLDASTIDPNL